MATKVKRMVVGVLVAVALVLSGCDGVSYNGDASTWNSEPVNAKGGVICAVSPELATCK